MTTREQIVALHLKGLTYGEIKYALGLSRGTIGGHLARWRKAEGVEPGRVNERAWTSSEEGELSRMFRAGAPVDAIARNLDRSERAIRSRISLMRSEDRMDPARVSDDYAPERSFVVRQRKADARFCAALAAAFQRGDHLSQDMRLAA
jgi:DNA-binding CsgD family transcriptional regulator